jgi:hypothetical protein
MNEAGFTRYIFKKLPLEIYKWKIMNMMQNGVPDCYFSGSHGDLWVEVKYQKAPKKVNTKFKANLSTLQDKWLTERSKEGRNVAVVLGTDLGCRIFKYNDWSISLRRPDLIHTRADVIQWICKQTLG